LSMAVVATVGCASSSPSRPTEATEGARSGYSPTAQAFARRWSLIKGGASASSRGVKAAAVINGFRVHPDPDDDGVIRVVEGQNVVVNATEIQSRPPDPRSYWVANWAAGP